MELVRFAYADPPYLGSASKHYGRLHPDADDFDTVEAHRALIWRLVDEFPDGWGFSLSSTSLQTILPLCPDDVRVCAWVKGWCSWKRGVSPAYAWEPVILRGGRHEKGQFKTRDWVMANAESRKSHGIPGAKPAAFCEWLLTVLGYQDGDEMVDLFPGTGIMGRVVAQGRLAV